MENYFGLDGVYFIFGFTPNSSIAIQMLLLQVNDQILNTSTYVLYLYPSDTTSLCHLFFCHWESVHIYLFVVCVLFLGGGGINVLSIIKSLVISDLIKRIQTGPGVMMPELLLLFLV